MLRACALALVLTASCSSGAQPVATAPSTSTPLASTSTTTTFAADSPVGIADAFMGYVQHHDCPAALAVSSTWMWQGALTPDQARLNCPAVLGSVPEITAVRRTEVTTRLDIARELGVSPDSFSMDLLGYPDAAIFYEVTYANGVTGGWMILLADNGPDGWEVVESESF